MEMLRRILTTESVIRTLH